MATACLEALREQNLVRVELESTCLAKEKKKKLAMIINMGKRKSTVQQHSNMAQQQTTFADTVRIALVTPEGAV